MNESLREAIRHAEGILPGEAVEEGEDPRWQAMIAIGEFVQSEPEAIWSFICRWGAHSDEDLRDAIASCLLEHLLEFHFDDYFPQVEARAIADPLFADMFLRSWAFGQTEQPDNFEEFKALRERLRESVPRSL